MGYLGVALMCLAVVFIFALLSREGDDDDH